MKTRAALGLVLLLALGCGSPTPEPPPGLTGTTKNPVSAPGGPQSVARSASPTPLAGVSPASMPVRSADSLSFHELVAGILELERSPEPITREQAVRILPALEGKVEAFEQGSALSAQAEQILSAEQKRFLLAERSQFRARSAADNKRFLEALARTAGPGASPAGAAGQAAPEGGKKPEAPFLDLVAGEFEALQAEPGLALTAEQARRLLPLSEAYAKLPSTVDELLMDILTPSQRTFIVKNLAVPVPGSGKAEAPPVEKVRELARERAGGA